MLFFEIHFCKFNIVFYKKIIIYQFNFFITISVIFIYNFFQMYTQDMRKN